MPPSDRLRYEVCRTGDLAVIGAFAELGDAIAAGEGCRGQTVIYDHHAAPGEPALLGVIGDGETVVLRFRPADVEEAQG